MNTFEDYPEVQSLIVRGFLSCECNPCAEISTESNALVKITECTLHCHNARSILFVHACNTLQHMYNEGGACLLTAKCFFHYSMPPKIPTDISVIHDS